MVPERRARKKKTIRAGFNSERRGSQSHCPELIRKICGPAQTQASNTVSVSDPGPRLLAVGIWSQTLGMLVKYQRTD